MLIGKVAWSWFSAVVFQRNADWLDVDESEIPTSDAHATWKTNRSIDPGGVRFRITINIRLRGTLRMNDTNSIHYMNILFLRMNDINTAAN